MACRETHKHERSLVEKYKDKPFVILGVNADASLDTMRRSLKEQHMTWTSVWDGPNQQNAHAYGDVHSFPTAFLIDPQGRFATKPMVGMQNSQQLETVIDRLLAEAEKDAAPKAE